MQRQVLQRRKSLIDRRTKIIRDMFITMMPHLRKGYTVSIISGSDIESRFSSKYTLLCQQLALPTTTQIKFCTNTIRNVVLLRQLSNLSKSLHASLCYIEVILRLSTDLHFKRTLHRLAQNIFPKIILMFNLLFLSINLGLFNNNYSSF